MSRYNRRWLSAALVAASLGAFTLEAGAQTDAERAGARAQATAGAEAFDAGRWQDAVDSFTRAESLVHSPVHLIYLAKAQLQLGRLVQAQEALAKILNEDVPEGAPQPLVDAHTEAQSLISDVQARIPQLKIVVEGAPGDVEVKMDGEPVPPALVGVPQPVNPGEHRIEAVGNGYAGSSTVTVAERASESVVVQMQQSADAQLSGAATGTDAVPEDTGAEPAASSDGLRYGGYAALGVGVIGLGVGTIFAISSSSTRGDADDQYDACVATPGTCGNAEEAEIKDLDSDADSAGVIATIGFVAGGVGLATGITLLVLSSGGGEAETPAEAQAPRITPYVGFDRIGVLGRF